MHGRPSRRLAEVDRLHRAGLGAGAAEGAGLEVDRALNAAVVELAEDRFAARLLATYLANLFADAAVDAVLRDDVRQLAQRDLEIAGPAADRLDAGSAPDVQIGIVDGDVSVEALAHSRLGIGRRQALAAVVGGKDGADAGRAAAQEGPSLDQLDAVPHLRQLGRGLRARDAAADHEHRVDPVLEHQLVVVSPRKLDRRLDDSPRFVGHGLDVAVVLARVHPGTAFADIGHLHAQPPLEQPVKTTVGEVLRAAGEDERPVAVLLHHLEQTRLALAVAPDRRPLDLGCIPESFLEALEIDVLGHRPGALAKKYARLGSVLRLAHASSSRRARIRATICSPGTGTASTAPVGQMRAQAPQPMHLSAS